MLVEFGGTPGAVPGPDVGPAAAAALGVPAIKPTADADVVNATCGTVTFILRRDVVLQVDIAGGIACTCPSGICFTSLPVPVVVGQGIDTTLETETTVSGAGAGACGVMTGTAAAGT